MTDIKVSLTDDVYAKFAQIATALQTTPEELLNKHIDDLLAIQEKNFIASAEFLNIS